MKKKIVSLIFAAVFIVTSFPIECFAAVDSESVCGIWSVNNNNKYAQHEISDEKFDDVIDNIGPYSRYVEKYNEEKRDRAKKSTDTSESYLVDNEILSNPIEITSDSQKGVTLKQHDVSRITKTDLVCMLYKIYYEVLDSRPLVFETKSIRDLNGQRIPVDSVSNYQPHKREKTLRINATFGEGDYWIYVAPDVKEMYLTRALELGMIDRSEISNAKFLEEFDAYEGKNEMPCWASANGIAYISDKDCSEALGQSYSIENGNVIPKNVSYFKHGDDGDLTLLEALQIVEKFARNFDKQMTDLEASTVTYKFGAKYLESLSSVEKKTVTYLTTLGVIDFENELDGGDTKAVIKVASQLYTPWTKDAALTILYRLKNKAARFDFSKIQLTDQEAFWQEKGYLHDEIICYSQDTPDIRITNSNDDGEVAGEVVVPLPGDTGENGTTGSGSTTGSSDWNGAGLVNIHYFDKETQKGVEGVEVNIWIGDQENPRVETTDSRGIIQAILPFEKIRIAEKTCPDSWDHEAISETFALTPDDPSKIFTCECERIKMGTVQFITSNGHEGIKIYSNEDEFIEEITTDRDGKRDLNLPIGNYRYMLSSKEENSANKVDFNVLEDQNIIIEVKDETLISKIKDSLDSLFDIETIYAAEKKTKTKKFSIEIECQKTNENGEDYTYTYNNKVVLENVSPSEIKDLSAPISINRNDNKEYYHLKLLIKAENREQAIAKVNKKLKCTNLKTNGVNAISGVVKVDDDGNSTILVSKKTVQDEIKGLKIVNDYTIKNAVTDSTALFIQEKGYALVGNKIIINKDVMVKDTNGTIYYNLEALCSLLSNTMLSKINGQDSLVSTTSKEEVYTVKSSSESELEKNYVTKFTGATKDVDGGDGDSKVKTTVPEMYSVDSLSRASNTLVRTFDATIRNAKGKSNKEKITVIVSWNLVRPADITDFDSIEVKNEASPSELTFSEFTKVLYTKPDGSEQAEWWDRNIELTNALCNFMYNTKDTNYATTGWLAPSVTILSTGGSRKKDFNGSLGNIRLCKNSLSDKQIASLFSKMTFSSDYVKKYLGGSSSEWWVKFFNMENSGDLTKRLTAATSFRCLAATKRIGNDGSATPDLKVTDGYVFGNTQYVVLKNGKVFQDPEDTDNISINTKSKELLLKTRTTNKIVKPSVGSEVIRNGITYKYIGTKKIGDSYYLALVPYVNGGQNTTKNSNGEGIFCETIYKGDESSFNNVLQYEPVSSNYKTLYNFEDEQYKKFYDNNYKDSKKAIKSMKEKLTLSDRFPAVNNKNYFFIQENRFYGGFLGGKKSTFAIRTYKKKNIEKDISSDQMISVVPKSYLAQANKSKNKNKNKYHMFIPTCLYVPRNAFYFSQNDNGEYLINSGTNAQVLGSSVYFCGMNNMIRDQILSKQNGVKSVNDIPAGSVLFVNDMKFTKGKSDSFTSEWINDSTTVTDCMKAFNSGNSNSIKSSLLQKFSSATIFCAGRKISLAGFIEDIKLGSSNSVPKKKKDSFSYLRQKGRTLYYKVPSYKEKKYSSSEGYPSVNYFKINCSFDDNLLCMPIDSGNNVYQVLMVTDSYVSSGLENLPFYPSYDESKPNGELILDWRISASTLAQFRNDLRDEFVGTYKEAVRGDIVNIFKSLLISIMAWLSIFQWFAYIILTKKIGYFLFESIAMPNSRRFSRGFDLIKILSFGMYDIDDEPRAFKIVMIDFLLFLMMYVLVSF
jgi:hypothetical protein